MIVDDPDAPNGLFVHWLLYGLPSTEKSLAEGLAIEGDSAPVGRQGKNGFGKVAYGGPCPPSGTHTYYFHLYALDNDLGSFPARARRHELENAMHGHVLAEAQLMGRYERRQRRSPE